MKKRCTFGRTLTCTAFLLTLAAPQRARAQAALSAPAEVSPVAASIESPEASASELPDAPSFLATALEYDGLPGQSSAGIPPPCPPNVFAPYSRKAIQQTPTASAQPAEPCLNEHPLQIVVNARTRQPLTVWGKGLLAFRSVSDPANLGILGVEAGIGVAANSHSAYGPGFKGFGRLYGYQLLQDAQGEFLGTFAIPSLVREDPRYRRMEKAPIPRRVLHALSRTLIAEHDNGSRMINYATLLTYPISAELSNLYVPGVQSNAPSTMKRIAIGYATDPVGNLIAEFLPDLARRIHIRSVFVQQIVNSMALNPTGAPN